MIRYVEQDWISILEDYFTGNSQRYLEKKYDIPIKTIHRNVKFIMTQMMSNPSGTLRKNWDNIKREVEVINGRRQGIPM